MSRINYNILSFLCWLMIFRSLSNNVKRAIIVTMIMTELISSTKHVVIKGNQSQSRSYTKTVKMFTGMCELVPVWAEVLQGQAAGRAELPLRHQDLPPLLPLPLLRAAARRLLQLHVTPRPPGPTWALTPNILSSRFYCCYWLYFYKPPCFVI